MLIDTKLSACHCKIPELEGFPRNDCKWWDTGMLQLVMHIFAVDGDCLQRTLLIHPQNLSSRLFSIVSPLIHPLSCPPFPSPSSYVVAVPGLVCSPLPAGVGFGAGRIRSMPVFLGARTAGCPQVEQQNCPASPAGGQRELQR